MAGPYASSQNRTPGVALYLFIALCVAGRAMGQFPPGVFDSLPQADGQTIVDAESPPYARYDEPPPPPFDYWQPTWMPCQSLRANRSLVLGHLYWGAEILGWSTKGVHVPPLVTASSPADGGVIGQGNTRILFGEEWQQNELRPGGRLTIGWWFNPNQYRGIEWHYFELDGQNIRFNAAETNGAANGILARPIIDPNTAGNAAVIIASGDQNGSIRVASDLQLTSTGILFRDLFWASPYARVDYLVGYRHTHLFDRLRTEESLTALAGNPDFTAGQHITRVDLFRAVNQFDGADFGLKSWWSNDGKLAVTGLAKIAIGASNNDVIISGYTQTGSGRNVQATQGGVLALPSNIGRRAQQEFGYVTEIGGGLEWQPICYWKFSLGYTWFYWSEVARAISQIDRTVDTTQLAPTNSTTNCGCPAFHMHTTSFWAQGLNAGFSYQF